MLFGRRGSRRQRARPDVGDAGCERRAHAAAEDLAELPGVEPHIRLVRAVHRRFHDDCWRAVARAGDAAIDQATHVVRKAGHVESAVLHADIDVVGPGGGVGQALRMGEHVAGMRADIVDRLALRQEFDRAVDAAGHGVPLWAGPGEASTSSATEEPAVRLSVVSRLRRIPYHSAKLPSEWRQIGLRQR